MPKKHFNVAHRAWNLLRLALLWARKGGMFKRRLGIELRLVQKFLKGLGHANQRDQIHYGEREFSFDKMPIFHVKMHRPGSMRFRMPHIPCINPQVDFDYDFDVHGEDEDEVYNYNCGRKSFLKGEGEDCEEMVACEEEEGIDLRADKFIAKFYEQMKLQRQISYLQYQ